MKLQIDTTNKTIRIEEPVNIGELMALLEKILPNSEWKEFSLEIKTIEHWVNPVPIIINPAPTINPYIPTPGWPNYPTMYGMETAGHKLHRGTTNFEIKYDTTTQN